MIYVGVILSDKLNNLRRIDGGKVHVRFEFHSCHFGEVIKNLAILATAECKPKSISLIERARRSAFHMTLME
jgi:hypothetical protein